MSGEEVTKFYATVRSSHTYAVGDTVVDLITAAISRTYSLSSLEKGDEVTLTIGDATMGIIRITLPAMCMVEDGSGDGS